MKYLITFWWQYLSIFCVISSTFWKLFINGPLTLSCIYSNWLMVYLTDLLCVPKSLWFDCKTNDKIFATLKTSSRKQICTIASCCKSWSHIPINSTLVSFTIISSNDSNMIQQHSQHLLHASPWDNKLVMAALIIVFWDHMLLVFRWRWICLYYWNGKLSGVSEGLSQLSQTMESHYTSVWSTMAIGGFYSLCKLIGANNFLHNIANHWLYLYKKENISKVVNSHNAEETIIRIK